MIWLSTQEDAESTVAFGLPTFTSYNQAMSTNPAITRIADHRRCTEDE
jgi:hypothetical protein